MPSDVQLGVRCFEGADKEDWPVNQTFNPRTLPHRLIDRKFDPKMNRIAGLLLIIYMERKTLVAFVNVHDIHFGRQACTSRMLL